ncbi:MAG: helix-turn-helix domain-containing protein [Bacillota bacterium]
MEKIGVKFRKKREELEIPLAQARNETKIRMSYLKAIEDGNFEEIEQEVYLKGFLKIYADYLGLNEKKILEEYRENKEIIKREQEREALGVSAEDAPEQKISIGERIKDFIDQHQNKLLYAFIAGLIVVIIVVILFMGNLVYKSFFTKSSDLFSNVETNVEDAENQSSETKEKSDLQLDNGEQPEQPEQLIQQPQNQQSEEKQENQEQEIINLVIEAVDNSWCAIEVDNKSVFRGIIMQGERKKLKGKDIKLKISNAAGVKIIKNGQERGPFGKKGEVIVKEYSVNNN